MSEESLSGGDRLKEIEDAMSSIKDLQSVLELDIVNLKNEIEKIKLVSPDQVPPEVQENIIKLEHIAKDVGAFKKWEQTVDEVKFLRNKVMGMKNLPEPSAPTTEASPVPSEDIQQLKKQVADLRANMLLKPGTKPLETGDLRKAIDDNRRTIESLKGNTPSGKVKQPEINTLKTLMEENRKSIENLKLMVDSKHHTEIIPSASEIRKTVDENKKAFENLKKRVEKSATGDSSVLNARVTELIDMVEGNKKAIEEIKVRIIKAEGKGGAGLEEQMEDEMEELRNLLFSKLGELNNKAGQVKTEDLKNMITENRSAMEKLKERVFAQKTEKSEFPLPMKDRINELEKKIVSLTNLVEKTKGIKPIEIPPGMSLSKDTPSKTITKKFETIKTKVDDLMKRMKTSEIQMNSLVKKEDLVALENTLKPQMLSDKEKKMLSDDALSDIENVKKAIVRNEDHINNLVSDIEQVKRELSTIEKREWGEVGERPTLEEMNRRIEDLEKKLAKEGLGTAPIFIE